MDEVQQLFFEAFAESTEQVLKSAATLATQRKTPFTKGTAEQPPFDIAGFIGVISPKVRGSVALCFPKEVFLKILSNMLMEQYTEITRENEDAAAELLNMIFGRTKKVLNEKGYAVRSAIPTVFRGGRVHSSYAKNPAVSVLPFNSEPGDFHLEFLLQALTPAEAETISAVAKTSTTPSSEAAFFKPFIDATVKAFNVQCGITAKHGKPFYKKDAKDYSFDVAGIVGISSKTLNGSFMLNFKRPTFLALVGKMLGETYTDFQPGAGLEDMACEFVNIIFGMAKVPLNQQGHGVHMAIPTMVRGDMIVSSSAQKRPTVVIPFESELGGFCIEITIE